MPAWLILGIMGMAFTFVLATGQTAYWMWVARQERQQEELLRRISGQASDQVNPAGLFRENEQDAAGRALGSFGDRAQEVILAADSTLTVSALLTQMGVLAAVGCLLGFFFIGPIGIFLGLPVGYARFLILQFQASSRTAKLVEQLPDTLDMIARALQAGVGLSDAFRLASEEMPPPVSVEFSRVHEEIRFGRDFREAFGMLIKRNPKVFDLRLMVSSILLQRETGGNLIEILENISDTIRTRFAFQAKVKAMTSEAKFTAVILGGLPLGVASVLMIMSPDYLSVLPATLVGNVILVAAALMYGTGVFIMRALSTVEV